MLRGDSVWQCLEIVQGVVDGLQCGLLGLRLAAEGVAAHLEAGLLYQLAQFDHAVVLAEIVALQQRRFDLSHPRHGIFGTGDQIAPGCLAILHGALQVGKCPAIFGSGRHLLVELGQAVGVCQLLAGVLQAIVEFVEQVADRADALFAGVHFVIKARNPQVLGQFVEAGDGAQLVTPGSDRVQAQPTGQRDQKGQ